jgi:hypothetical protein
MLVFLGQAQHDAKVARGAASLIKLVQSSLPHDIVAFKSKERHATWKLDREVKRALGAIKKMITCKGISFAPTIRNKTYEVAVDAAGDGYVGLSSVGTWPRHQRTIKYEGKLFESLGLTPEAPIYLKEMFAVICALRLAPYNCNLRIFSDN